MIGIIMIGSVIAGYSSAAIFEESNRMTVKYIDKLELINDVDTIAHPLEDLDN